MSTVYTLLQTDFGAWNFIGLKALTPRNPVGAAHATGDVTVIPPPSFAEACAKTSCMGGRNIDGLYILRELSRACTGRWQQPACLLLRLTQYFGTLWSANEVSMHAAGTHILVCRSAITFSNSASSTRMTCWLLAESNLKTQDEYNNSLMHREVQR